MLSVLTRLPGRAHVIRLACFHQARAGFKPAYIKSILTRRAEGLRSPGRNRWPPPPRIGFISAFRSITAQLCWFMFTKTHSAPNPQLTPDWQTQRRRRVRRINMKGKGKKSLMDFGSHWNDLISCVIFQFVLRFCLRWSWKQWESEYRSQSAFVVFEVNLTAVVPCQVEQCSNCLFSIEPCGCVKKLVRWICRHRFTI